MSAQVEKTPINKKLLDDGNAFAFINESDYDVQADLTSLTTTDVGSKLQSLKDNFFIVKIGGKGNVDDTHGLKNNDEIGKAVITIIDEIDKYNKPVKDVLIIWDGDNYQAFEDLRPSPFTVIIGKLRGVKSTYKFAAFKDSEWRADQVKTWKSIMNTFYKFLLPQSKTITTSWLAHMYITWGSMYYGPPGIEAVKYMHQAIHDVTNKKVSITHEGEGNGYGHFLQYRLANTISNEPERFHTHMEIAVKPPTTHSETIDTFDTFIDKFITETANYKEPKIEKKEIEPASSGGKRRKSKKHNKFKKNKRT